MRFLLDTNVLVFLLSAPGELSPAARRVVETEPDVFVGRASLWEIAIKQARGKLSISLDIPGIEARCLERRIRFLPLSSSAIERVKTLPDIHRDPFDRLLVAQAIDASMTLVTRDRTIPLYPVPTLW